MGQLLKTAKQSLFHHKNQSYYQLMSDLEADDWTVYPRPQMRRDSYMSLNGQWTIRNQHANGKDLPDQTIRVPFPPQAALSGYEIDDIAKIPEELFYEKTFCLPTDFLKNSTDRILLHFGAVDQIAQVFINSRPVGTHEGGYLPFTFDITDYLRWDIKTTGDSHDKDCYDKGCYDNDYYENVLQVLVEDHLDHFYPWGKQKKDRGGMWYTPVTGIWQSVWLEAVPESYIGEMSILASADGEVTIHLEEGHIPVRKPNKALEIDITQKHFNGSGREEIRKHVIISIAAPKIINLTNMSADRMPMDLITPDRISTDRMTQETGNTIADFTAVCDENGMIHFRLQDKLSRQSDHSINKTTADSEVPSSLSLWSPEEPWLYPMTITYGEDRIETYFGLRTISLKRMGDYTRVCLNDHQIFLHGVLDQGYFSDGLYLPANSSGYIRDIQSMKDLGFNLLRKHIKVEPDIFYYYCDCMGMMVMQDMVNNGPYSFLLQTALPTIGLKKQPEARHSSISKRENERRRYFLEHSKGIQKQVYNHPCVIAYTVFNEGWGQFASKKVGDELRKNDPTRLYDYTSGWFEHGGSDFESIHEYFHPGQLLAQDHSKALFLSECGGCTWQIPDHSYSMSDSYGYGTCTSALDLTDHIISVYENMVLPSITTGLCGCIYTQLSDVEDEVNGLLTYDRSITKPDSVRMQDLARKLKNHNNLNNETP